MIVLAAIGLAGTAAAVAAIPVLRNLDAQLAGRTLPRVGMPPLIDSLLGPARAEFTAPSQRPLNAIALLALFVVWLITLTRAPAVSLALLAVVAATALFMSWRRRRTGLNSIRSG
jgi:hypothetical protein